MRLRPRLRSRVPLGRVGLLITFAALSGCDVPTTAPLIDVRWVFPIEDQSISVVELLPGNVTVSGGSFQVGVDPFSLDQTLGVLCSACVGSGGIPVPKPAFNLVYNQSGSLGTDVVSVELVSGSISLAIQNNLGFDPINPAPASPGTFTVTLLDTDINGDTLSQVMLDGANGDVLPAGLTTIPLNLPAGTITSAIFAVADLVSPAGDPVPIDLAAGFNIAVTVGTILVSSATVNVDGLTVDIAEQQLDLEDVDADIVTLQRVLDIGSGANSSATLFYTGAELQSFLGMPGVFFRGSGTVTGGPATVTPAQVAVLEATLDVELELGG